MNERIQELATQAGYTPLPGFDFANSMEEVFIKKFAKLIVRECAVPMITMAREMDTNSCKNNPVEVNAMALHQGLMKHFGVE